MSLQLETLRAQALRHLEGAALSAPKLFPEAWKKQKSEEKVLTTRGSGG